jgi:CubicO group peptidase (beta-lactamase class C family)
VALNVYKIALVALGLIEGFSSCATAQPAHAILSDVSAAQVDRIFAKWNHTDSPGCAVAVMFRGQIVYEHGYGMADLSHNVAITPTTTFHVASVSKQFTAAAVVLLAQQGRLSLDDDVHKYIPELPHFGYTITIRDLLHHVSGLRDQWDLLGLAGFRYTLDLITDADVINLVMAQRDLNFPPETEYLYSNTGYTMAGLIVQRVSGQSLRQFTSDNIFAPLGMSDTHFRDDHSEINKGEAFGYKRGSDGAFRLSVTNFDTVGATSLYTTVEDLAKWDENFYVPLVGGSEFAREMTKTEPLRSGKANYYAMGLMLLRYRNIPIVEHGGSDAGYRANILRFPEQHFSVVTLCNTLAVPAELNRRLADLYLHSIFQEPAVMPLEQSTNGELPSAVLEGKAGYYRSEATGAVLRLNSAAGMLRLVDHNRIVPLRNDGGAHFFFPDAIDPFHFEPLIGEARRVVIEGEGKPAELWDRIPTYSFSPRSVGDFLGGYYSQELDATYVVSERAGVLILTRSKYGSDELEPVAADLFTGSVGILQFTRGRGGKVDGLLLTASDGRARDLRFEWRISGRE